MVNIDRSRRGACPECRGERRLAGSQFPLIAGDKGAMNGAPGRGSDLRGVFGQGGAEFVDVGAVGSDGLVEGFAGDAELFGPVGDVRGHFGVDLFGVVGALGVFFVGGVEFVGFGCVVVLGHAGFLFSGWCWLGG